MPFILAFTIASSPPSETPVLPGVPSGRVSGMLCAGLGNGIG
jgi:hypothetical protein